MCIAVDKMNYIIRDESRKMRNHRIKRESPNKMPIEKLRPVSSRTRPNSNIKWIRNIHEIYFSDALDMQIIQK